MTPRKKSETLLNALDYDFNTFTVDNFIHHIAHEIERDIHYIPWPMPPYMSGVWFTDLEDGMEYVFIDDGLSGVHQTHVKLHELAHIIFNHKTLAVSKERIPEILTALLSDQEREAKMVVRSILRRSLYDGAEEQEAEMWASVILERVARSSRLNELKKPSTQQHTINFLSEVGLDR